jgi:hypothetical protein
MPETVRLEMKVPVSEAGNRVGDIGTREVWICSPVSESSSSISCRLVSFMRLEFRSVGQADRYYKILKKVVEDAGRGGEGNKMGRERIRNAIYRGFGYNHFPQFERILVPNKSVKAWFHSREQLEEAFSRALADAVEVARERGFEFHASTEELTRAAVNLALEVNERALQNLLNGMHGSQ